MPKETYVTARFPNYANAYTYKTTLDLRVGEDVIVNTPKSGLSVVRITAVGVPKPKFECKWIAAQIDLEYYNSLPH